MAAAWALVSAVGGWRSRLSMMVRICVATSVVVSGFKNDGGVLGLDPFVIGRARWSWACWTRFDIVCVSVKVPAAVPREASD